MLVKNAKLLGNISKGNTKMPGTTFAIDAFACNTGSKLAKIAGTPCSVCYARHLQRIRPSVDQGWKANLAKFRQAATDDNLTAWVDAMTFQILRYNTDLHHRWFDSGDLQSVEMLRAICNVCALTPQIKHWLPTQERAIVQEFKRSNTIPANLVIRISASKINGTQTIPLTYSPPETTYTAQSVKPESVATIADRAGLAGLILSRTCHTQSTRRDKA